MTEIEYTLSQLQKAINEGNTYHMRIYLRLLTKEMGIDRGTYQNVIKQIYEAQRNNPDLDI